MKKGGKKIDHLFTLEIDQKCPSLKLFYYLLIPDIMSVLPKFGIKWDAIPMM